VEDRGIADPGQFAKNVGGLEAGLMRGAPVDAGVRALVVLGQPLLEVLIELVE